MLVTWVLRKSESIWVALFIEISNRKHHSTTWNALRPRGAKVRLSSTQSAKLEKPNAQETKSGRLKHHDSASRSFSHAWEPWFDWDFKKPTFATFCVTRKQISCCWHSVSSLTVFQSRLSQGPVNWPFSSSEQCLSTTHRLSVKGEAAITLVLCLTQRILCLRGPLTQKL